MSGKKIEFTMESVERLQLMYDSAVKNNVKVFEFEGQQVLTAYAKYLLEYLRMKLDGS